MVFLLCRGKFRSKPYDSIIQEAKYLVSQGALELNLIAEDTNQWGQDRRDGRNLSHLLRALGEIEGLRWIRLLYCYPSYFNDELIDEIATNPKVRPNFTLFPPPILVAYFQLFLPHQAFFLACIFELPFSYHTNPHSTKYTNPTSRSVSTLICLFSISVISLFSQ